MDPNNPSRHFIKDFLERSTEKFKDLPNLVSINDLRNEMASDWINWSEFHPNWHALRGYYCIFKLELAKEWNELPSSIDPRDALHVLELCAVAYKLLEAAGHQISDTDEHLDLEWHERWKPRKKQNEQ